MCFAVTLTQEEKSLLLKVTHVAQIVFYYLILMIFDIHFYVFNNSDFIEFYSLPDSLRYFVVRNFGALQAE